MLPFPTLTYFTHVPIYYLHGKPVLKMKLIKKPFQLSMKKLFFNLSFFSSDQMDQILTDLRTF